MAQPNSDEWALAGRTNRSRWALRLVAIAPVMLVVGWLVWKLAIGDRTVYDVGPLTTSHAMFRNECQQCHQRPDESPQFDEHVGWSNVGPVPDTACLACHDAAVHHTTQVAHNVHRCAHCHREHRGQRSLARVADAFCTSCHADLMTTGPAHAFAQRIDSFAKHPEFAMRRRGPKGGTPREDLPPGEALRPGEGHRVYEVAELVDNSGSWTWRDKSKLRFNHQYHMHREGVLVPASHPEHGDGTKFKRLECSDCHVPDDDGRTMRPINYELHCKACHPLEFSPKLQQMDAALDLTGPLPHVEPRLIRGLLLDRLLAYARKHPEVVLGQAGPLPRLPNKTPAPAAKDEWAWVETQLAQTAEVIAGAASPHRPGTIDFMHGCRHCHQITRKPGTDPGAMLDWEVEPPNIPSRRMPHSRFRHDSHRMSRCEECHSPATTSTQTSDVLLPSIKVCQQCHNPARGIAGSARTDCVGCHTYHNHDER